MLILERPWTKQPQTVALSDVSAPLTKNLVLLWSPIALASDVSGYGRMATVASGGLVKENIGGRGYDNAGAGGISFTSLPDTSNGVTLFRLTTYVAKSTFTNAKLQFGIPYVTFLNASLYYSGGNLLAEAGDTTIGADKPINAISVTHPGSGTTATFRLNGGAGVNVTTGGTMSGVQTLRIGTNLNTGLSPTSNTIVYMVAMWTRVLTTGELNALFVNPWQLFAPRRIYIPTSTAAATVPTLSASTYVPGSLTSTGWRPQVTAS